MSASLLATGRRLALPPLWLAYLLSLAGYLALRLWFPLRPHYLTIPLPDILTFTPGPLQGLGYGALLVALFVLHAWAIRSADRLAAPSPWPLLAGAALLCLPLLGAYPVNAADLHRYVIVGRLASLYGADPFAAPPSAFPEDPFVPMAGEWVDATSPYGPLWEGLAMLVTGLAGGRFLPSLIAFKAVQAAALLAVGGLIWAAARGRAGGAASPAALLVAWSWNPALLLLFVVDGHNDALMIAFLVGGWWLMRRGWPGAGILVALIGGLIKPIGLLALPFLGLAGWRALPAPRGRRRFLLIAFGGGLALAWLAFLPYGSPLDLGRRLLFESGEVAGFSPATLAVLALGRLGVPDALGSVRAAGLAAFVIAGLLLGWRAWRGRPAVAGIADAFFLYLWTALAFRLWYAAWPFAWWLLESPAGRRARAGFWFLATAQLSVLIYGHIWRFALNRDHFWSHLIGVPFTFALPWLLARRRGARWP